MTLELTEKQITELQKAQKEKRNAPYHRRIKALILRGEGHSYCKIGWLFSCDYYERY